MLLILASLMTAWPATWSRRVASSGGRWRWLTPLDLAEAGGRASARTADPGGDLRVETLVRPAAGPTIDLSRCSGVLNRVGGIPPARAWQPADGDYAAAERHALLISALAAIPAPVVNPVRPPSASGPLLDTMGWLALAGRAGVPTRALRVTTDGRRFAVAGWQACEWQSVTTVGISEPAPLHAAVPVGQRPVAWAEEVGPVHRCAVVGGEVFGEPSPAWRQHGARMAAAAGCPLLELHLARRADDGAWVVAGADPNPAALAPPAIAALVGIVGDGGTPSPGAADSRWP